MAVFYFIVGCILGSFLLVIGTRLPNGEDVLVSRSRCDHCKKDLKWYHLIPLFSFIFLNGKCAYCHKKISPEHFIVELGTGLIFLATYFLFKEGYNLYVGLTIASLLIVIFVSDFKYMIILDSPLIVASIIIIILKFIYFGYQEVLLSIASGLALFVVMYVVQLLGNYIFKKESLGGGDIKLAFVIGLVLGFKLGLVALILSAFVALPYAIAIMHLNKESEFPYGPFLVGALLIIFYNYEKFELLFKFIFRFI